MSEQNMIAFAHTHTHSSVRMASDRATTSTAPDSLSEGQMSFVLTLSELS